MRSIQIHDTLTNEVKPLITRDPGKVSIYACGPTVYSRIHIGNARPYTVFMLLQRFLEHEGYDVTFAVNVTDINDKIYVAAREADVHSAQLAHEMTEHYFEDTSRLGLGRPDHEPLATETVPEIVNLIEALIERDHAYESGGDVYFSVPSYERYGELSNRDPDAMDQGEEDNSLKRDARDFALWKTRKDDEDTAWPSPWGDGRPGWHIECSAMSETILGVDFDIHGGGIDLVFPHHENECAQTYAGRGAPLARLWMHNGMVRFSGEKMSKSVGNIWLLHEALDAYAASTLIMFFISGHYRAPIECTADTLAQAASNVERLKEVVNRLNPQGADDGLFAVSERFYAALADDFNTPAAMAEIFTWVRDANRRLDAGEVVGGLDVLREALTVLGLESVFESGGEEADSAATALLDARQRARAAKDFAKADALRDELLALGWEIRDTPEGPVLRSS
ncbi:MAG: cysteine--tRNA ligase [Thermoleophilaceae bacterium]|nr:cysteine--tRNA ligase [Thermoleophilaceae bacterium]